jgi:hypothetical protein
MAAIVHVCLAYPLPASFPLPPFDRRSIRYAYQFQLNSPQLRLTWNFLKNMPVKCGDLTAHLQPTDGNSETKSLPA